MRKKRITYIFQKIKSIFSLLLKREKLSEIEKSWLACAIDTDGSLKCYHKRRKGKWNGWEFKAIVVNTNKDLVSKAKELLDRFGNTYWQEPDRRGKKVIYWIALSSKNAIKELCKEIYPYLIKIILHKEDWRFKNGKK